MSTASTVQRILVVDDDREIVRLVRAYLEKEHYQVLIANDGQTALHMVRREHPNLIVLDLMLPDRDGWEITRTIRNDSTLHSIPIIMLTARVEDSEKIIGLELGADDYITKPFNPREMVARVRSVLRRAQGDDNFKKDTILQCGALLMDIGRREVIMDTQPVELTVTEFELLRALM